MELAGRKAVVIGGTSGIGKALALGLARAGANVIATSRSDAAVAETTAEIRSLGRESMEIVSDVLQRRSLQSLLEGALAVFGRVDILVNAAGITKREPTLEVSEETWNAILNVNLHGTLRACQVFGGQMITQGYGRIINIASLSSFVAFQEVTAYCASKAAVASLTRSLAVEWAKHGVLVNAVAPGIFPTALNSRILDSPRGQELQMRTPLARFGTTDELISTAVYLASEKTSFTNGQVIAVDGGFLASGVNQ
ncbi:SDR family NAD(P)-dependent oxidoreductase [Terriglobus roseus]|uniref:NAD(P)-dependent dehydrogenase, short-chain alcohol dehydrogenase family n=1 Tax=Terriglobus roseus TaxID=392734 RepID=A0A1H4NZS6_9BACT|nr:SDR family oxidoreductase [Terriglobus roseus]SEC00700.1 NAD(P)-dependent dehydrogenase, short-chain alcohol dehydrogenase family [Terriglobus roseus]